jgi:hypothetical protein
VIGKLLCALLGAELSPWVKLVGGNIYAVVSVLSEQGKQSRETAATAPIPDAVQGVPILDFHHEFEPLEVFPSLATFQLTLMETGGLFGATVLGECALTLDHGKVRETSGNQCLAQGSRGLTFAVQVVGETPYSTDSKYALPAHLEYHAIIV